MAAKRVVIIGGGLGGLALALRLAAKGYGLTICERGESFGGKMNSWSAQGYRFDTGPSLITMPWVFAELFTAAGSAIEDHLEVVPIHPISEYFYPDGTRFTYTSSIPDWFDTLRQIEPKGVEGFLRFLKLGSQLYEVSNETFLRRRPLDWPQFTDRKVLSHIPWRYGWGSYHKTVAAHFKSPYLQQLYDRYPTYVGSSPYKSPATLIVIPYIEYAFGGWYVQGGLYRIVESLVELGKNAGITFQLKSHVAQIEHRGNRVTGVRLTDDTRIDADLVVMNGDASNTRKMLNDIPPEPASDNDLPPHERSMSGFVMLLGVKRTMPAMKHHAIYFSADYRREFSQLFDERRFPEDPTVYVNVPSRSDRSLISGDGETLFIMANAPANDYDEWGEEQISIASQRVFARLHASGFPDLKDDVVVR